MVEIALTWSMALNAHVGSFSEEFIAKVMVSSAKLLILFSNESNQISALFSIFKAYFAFLSTHRYLKEV